MKVKDWSMAGQMLAWFLEIATFCKEWSISNGINPEIMAWVKETKVGREALAASLSQLAQKYLDYIIEWHGEATIPPQPRFVLAEHFISTANGDNYYQVDKRYNENLKMVEEPTEETKIVFGKLLLPSQNPDITPKLGSCPLLTISQVHWLMQQQPNGEKPDGIKRLLLSNGEKNFFRIAAEGSTRTDAEPLTDVSMEVSWHDAIDGKGWIICFSTTKKGQGWEAGVRWDPGARIFTGKSAETPLVERV